MKGGALVLTAMVLGAGCLDELLESPYVLASGLGEVRSLTPDGDGHFILATRDGVVEVDGAGKAVPKTPPPVFAVAMHPHRPYVMRDGYIEVAMHRIEVPGAVDMVAGWDTLMVLTPDGLSAVDSDQGTSTPVASGFGDARAVALGPSQTYLVVTPTTLWQVTREGKRSELATDLTDARAAATDGQGRVYVVSGAPEELWRVEPAGAPMTRIARYVGDVRDAHFGTGGLLPSDTLYLATGDGTLTYLKPPP